MNKFDLYWKRFGSTDARWVVIYRLEQMRLEHEMWKKSTNCIIIYEQNKFRNRVVNIWSFWKIWTCSSIYSIHTLFPIQNDLPTHSSSSSLSDKSLFPLLILESKKPIIKIKKNNYVDSDIEMQPLSSQQYLQPTLQTLQEDFELRRFKHQTQILLKKEIFMENKNILLIFCRILYGTQS